MSGSEYVPNINLQIPNRTGYMFDGWYTNTGYNTEWYGIIDSSTPSQTVYAKWLPFNDLNLVFSGNVYVIMDRNL